MNAPVRRRITTLKGAKSAVRQSQATKAGGEPGSVLGPVWEADC